jgi:hypothetical protein
LKQNNFFFKKILKKGAKKNEMEFLCGKRKEKWERKGMIDSQIKLDRKKKGGD